MYFFLQGERGIGKSSLLRQRLSPYWDSLAGFSVSRILSGGEIAGFRMQNVRDGIAELNLEDRPGLDNLFLYQGSRYPAVLEQVIRRVEADCRSDICRLVLLDEIGGVELLQPEFMEPLLRILDSGKPCAGTWKSAANLEHMMRRRGLSDGYRDRHRWLEEQLRRRGTLLTMTADNREQCAMELDGFLRKFCVINEGK